MLFDILCNESITVGERGKSKNVACDANYLPEWH